MDGEMIWGIVATVGAAGLSILAAFLKRKGGKYIDMIRAIIAAFDDGKVTSEEMRSLIKQARALVGR